MKKKFDKAKQSANRLMVKLNPGRRSRSRSPNAPDTDANASTSAPSEGRYSYADPKAPRTAIGTAGSVVNEFLAAARDGADLCLPLKAVLVGAVKIFEICEASIASTSPFIFLISLFQRTAEVSDQYNQLGSRLAHLGAVTGALHKRGHVDPNLMQRLENIAEYVAVRLERLQRLNTTQVIFASGCMHRVEAGAWYGPTCARVARRRRRSQGHSSQDFGSHRSLHRRLALLLKNRSLLMTYYSMRAWFGSRSAWMLFSRYVI